ncbi:MAG TPA: ABC transporter ATP-binding protein [Lichenihabitans sp.]|jgi:urea ABC transporter ATP-binding protein UrtE|nr:ABC transporter ATP-binding protein [Lichenihabitans sp.]
MMLDVEGLHSGYDGIPVLSGLSLRIEAGEFVGILGHNGMGKTTLLKTLIGILPATSGQIRFEGDPIARLPSHGRVRRGMGYVPQGRGIFPGLTVRDNLRFAAVAVGRRAATIASMLDEFPRLKALLERPGGALSGGEQQLLALARALIQHPRIVLLDEPTEGIQPSIIEEIVEQLKAMRARRGLTVLLVEQNVDFIKALSDRVLLIQKGVITREFAAGRVSDAAAMGDFG